MQTNDHMVLLKDIPRYKQWVKIELVNKGWSDDQKYKITDSRDKLLLLRLSDINEYQRKQEEYDMMTKASRLGIPMSMPLDFGICGEGTKVYTLLTWIEGVDAEDQLPTMSVEEQYQMGVKAGEILRKIHSLKPEKDVEPWTDTYNPKIDRVIKRYIGCSVKVDHDDMVLAYLAENRHLLEDRPITFQHGDYHIGNMLITPNDELSIIDFNRCSYGDPWEEYDRYSFTWDTSPAFANGQLHSYFNDQVPDEFFRLLALYNARNIIASIPWAIPFGEEDVNHMIKLAQKIIHSYQGFETYIPNWYQEPEKRK
ncbi:aminoglycoside phosphotransferase family protein [Vallitalea okinawensis]|uniref:aminoglycoside phosphotransferase family protein n=1 Tax=Vallitalea okinawensis TaxID=2078660 RepID=UPI001A9A6455|nr:phosphotransferase [Vallitalea okinawensis]